MDNDRFPRLVSLACHDLRTPLATIYGFARTLSRGERARRSHARFLGMIEEASEQMTGCSTSSASRRGSKAGAGSRRCGKPTRSSSRRVGRRARRRRGRAARRSRPRRTVVARALASFAVAAVRFGPVDRVTWHVDGGTLVLSPVTADCRAGCDRRDVPRSRLVGRAARDRGARRLSSRSTARRCASGSNRAAPQPSLERGEQRLRVQQQPPVLEQAGRHAAVHRLDEGRVLAADLVVEGEELASHASSASGAKK